MSQAMKRISFTVPAIFALLVSGAVRSSAQKQGLHEAEFRAFYADFIKAVRANDKEKITDMIKFPVDTDWSVDTKGNVETISVKDRADFIKRYSTLFTNYMRLHALKAKPEALQDGRYMLRWKDSDVECSFEFEYIDGTGYRVTSYTIGPL